MLTTATIRRELILAAALILFGFLPLPLAVYWVGQQLVGEYESDAGFVGLIGRIWSDFSTLEPGAWVLVLSPYLTVQLLRVARGTRHRSRNVTQASNSQETNK